MASKALSLAGILLKQNEILRELLDIVVKQKEALKEGRLSDLQNLMSDLRHISVRCQAIETKRARAADELSKELGCERIVSAIVRSLGEEEAPALEESAKKLLGTVNGLKREMTILSRLMEEAKTLNEMLIAEWRKLSQKSLGLGAMGTFDTRI
jgi:hypothetical protein